MDYEPRVTPLHKSLNEPALIAGAERELTILNATIAAAIIMGLGLLSWVLVSLFAQGLMSWMTKRDPMMRRIYIRYIKQSRRYDPWPRPSSRNQRPLGFDQGNLC